MKSQSKLKSLALICLMFICASGVALAQEEAEQQQQQQSKQTAAAAPAVSPVPGRERLEPDDTSVEGPANISNEMQANRREQASEEEAAVLPYYNNYLTTYRLGPEDVISVTVFGQERYSRAGITIPPNGRINYPLLQEGLLVAGKTTEQVAEELTRRLDEYIIEPKITVMLEKAMSARFSVLGDVGQPGIRVMTRRLSVYEAIAEAGGVLNTGDKSKVFILRRQADGSLQPTRVNLKEIERGRAKEMIYLAPGDQVVVPGNRMKSIKAVMDLLPILSFARIFGVGI